MSHEVVFNYCKSWGLTICESTDDTNTPVSVVPQSFHYGPTHNHMWWPCRVVWWRGRKQYDVYAVMLLHELSHALQEDPPDKVDELRSSMLAFEYFSAVHLGLVEQWDKFTQSLVADPGLKWKDFSQEERMKYIEDSLKKAVDEGLLTEAGEPTFKSRFLVPP